MEIGDQEMATGETNIIIFLVLIGFVYAWIEHRISRNNSKGLPPSVNPDSLHSKKYLE
jgi:hypothetical protein